MLNFTLTPNYVMDMEHYNCLRECELDAALHQVKTDYKDGNFIMEPVEDHIKRTSKFVKKHPELISQYSKTLKLL